MKTKQSILISFVITLLLTTAGTAAAELGMQITTNEADQRNPAISGDRIVWQDYRSGNWDIYMYDISTGIEKPITTSGFYQWYPDISGDRIVWEDSHYGNDDIYMHNILSKEEMWITTNEADQWQPAISGDRIIWHDNRNENWEIYMYEISTKEETQITTHGSYEKYPPAVDGDRIVWEDSHYENDDIYMYDISTKEETQITTNEADQWQPAISGDRIVWQDYRNGNADIYMLTLDAVENLNELQDYVNDEDLSTSTVKTLNKKLDSVITLLNKGEDESAIDKLEGFIGTVEGLEKSKKLTMDQAEYLITEAENIIKLIEISEG